MIYQETYQAGGDPNKLNISGVIYTHQTTPPHPAQSASPGSFPSHCHSFYEIDYTMDAVPGSLIFHPPLCMHAIINDRRRSHLLLQFSHNLLSSFASMENNCILMPDGALLHDGIIKLEKSSPAWECMQKLLETVPTFVLPVNEEENQITGYTFSDEIRLTSYTLSLLSCLLSEGNLIQEHSDLHSSSLEGMQMLLKRLVSIGYSYVDFCNIIRVRRAQELLQNSQKSVTEISTLLNFGSVSYFNRIFKKLTGCTPLAYRSSRG